MLWRLRTVALALIAVVAMAARPAAAAVVTATYSGTVASGFDFLGVFGTPGRDLSGKAYSARYVFDDRTPGLSRQTSSSLTYLFGYNRTGSPPFMASTLLIDGVQTVLTSPGSGAAYTLFNDPRDQIDHSFVSNFFDSGAFIDTWSMIFDVRSNVGFLPDKSYASPFTARVDPTATVYGVYGNSRYSKASNSTTSTILSFGIDWVSVSSVGPPIPDPRLWLLLTTGFGLVGWRLRSRRKATIAVRA